MGVFNIMFPPVLSQQASTGLVSVCNVPFSSVPTGEYWIGVFSLNNCFPIREVVIADYEQVNSTITTDFYDVVLGISNPNDFIPPPECQQAKWEKPSVRVPYL